MNAYRVEVKHGPDKDSITTICFQANDDDNARWYLKLLAGLLAAGDYKLTAKDDRIVEPQIPRTT